MRVACFPVVFESGEGEHPFNGKFKQLKTPEVGQIFKDPEYAVFGPCSCFFESASVRERLFEEKLPISEDPVWMAKLLLDRQDFGLLPKPCYRKGRHSQLAQDAAVETESDSPEESEASQAPISFYLDLPRQRHLEIFRHATGKYGEVPHWAQYAVLPDLARRIREKDEGQLTPEQKAEYRSLMQACFAQIDDQLLLDSPELDVSGQVCALALKYGVSNAEVKEWIQADEKESALLLCRPEAPCKTESATG